jgi:ubiquinone/menaquinone biosynthesis C-methylase UbiE
LKDNQGAAMFSPEQARRFYDRFGKKQDSQSFYENPALDKLIQIAEFENARAIVEFGYGTGRFALRLFDDCLSNKTAYHGFDISTTMVDLAKQRLVQYKGRASVTLTSGSATVPLEDGSCDRFISNYVLDLLTP